MSNWNVRIVYRKIIGANDPGAWEQLVSADTYQELLLQVQNFDREGAYPAYATLLYHVPAAKKLDFLVSMAITGYMQQLNGLIPDVKNALGKRFLPFHDYRFEIIHSNTRDRTVHTVAVNFYSDWIRWLDTVGDQLVLSVKEENGEVLTELLPLRPFISIYAVKEIE